MRLDGWFPLACLLSALGCDPAGVAQDGGADADGSIHDVDAGGGDPWSRDGGVTDAGPADGGAEPTARIVVVLESGPLTIEPRLESGEVVVPHAGAALDTDGDGASEAFFAAGGRLLELDPGGPTLVDRAPLVDGDGAPVDVDLLYTIAGGSSPLLVAVDGSDGWVVDLAAGHLNGPVPLVELTDRSTGATVPFAARSVVTVADLGGGIGGTFALAHGRTDLFLLDPMLRFTSLVASPVTCAEGAPVRVGMLSLGPPDEGGDERVVGIVADTMLGLHRSGCFGAPEPLRDASGQPVTPSVAFGGDVDGDGAIDLVLIAPEES